MNAAMKSLHHFHPLQERRDYFQVTDHGSRTRLLCAPYISRVAIHGRLDDPDRVEVTVLFQEAVLLQGAHAREFLRLFHYQWAAITPDLPNYPPSSRRYARYFRVPEREGINHLLCAGYITGVSRGLEADSALGLEADPDGIGIEVLFEPLIRVAAAHAPAFMENFQKEWANILAPLPNAAAPA
jgi:hypothetical protein